MKLADATPAGSWTTPLIVTGTSLPSGGHNAVGDAATVADGAERSIRTTRVCGASVLPATSVAWNVMMVSPSVFTVMTALPPVVVGGSVIAPDAE